MANPYTSHTRVLVTTIKIIQILRSPTLFDCQDLYTCGMKVMEVRKDPKYPMYSTMLAGRFISKGMLFILMSTKILLSTNTQFLHHFIANPGGGKSSIVEKILHGNHSGEV